MARGKESVAARSARRSLVGAALSLALALVACGSPKPLPPKVVATVSTKCPDLAKADEVAAFDFAKEYQLSRDAADKLKRLGIPENEIAFIRTNLRYARGGRAPRTSEFGFNPLMDSASAGTRCRWRDQWAMTSDSWRTSRGS